MIIQINEPSHLKRLLNNNLITFEQYLFRLEANKLNITTYKYE